jgi:5-methylcytosine-specific restriction endonuclease McrA
MGLKFSKKKQLGNKSKKKGGKKLGTKATADMWFSRYVRLGEADENGYVKCCTCPEKRYYTDQMENGHYISREKPLTRYLRENCATQCKKCNNFEKGKKAEHKEHIIKLYGESKLEELKELGSTRGLNVPKQDYAAISEKYKELAKIEAKKRGIKFSATTWTEFEKTGIIR